MPRVLITGAAGFIGMHTAIKFLQEGWEVIGLDNINDYYSVELKKRRINEINRISEFTTNKFNFIKADINSETWQLELSSTNLDAVIHLAAQAGVRYSLENPTAYLVSNIMGFQKVMDFVVSRNITTFIYASSSSVYGKSSKQPFSESEACVQPESFYAATKKANELMAFSYYQTKKVRSIGLRFFTVYGPWGRPDMAPFIFVNSAFKNLPIKVFNHGNQKRDFTYISDVVEGIYRSVLSFDKIKDASVFNIGNGSPIGLLDFINNIELSTGIKLNKTFTQAQDGDVEATWADTHKLKEFIDYEPKTDLDIGIRQFVKWYVNYFK
jgi:UDP-glucuronate 4-epimerase